VLNVFRMFSRMDGQRIAVTSDHALPLEDMVRRGVREDPDVGGLASLAENQLSILLWHYHDDDLPGPDAAVALKLDGLPATIATATLTHHRIDRDHSNAFVRWQQMGSPQNPTPEQYAELEAAGQLARLAEPAPVRVAEGGTELKITLPRQAVSLLELTW
jgi:xylan 1,4-beta-xylosidase